MNFELKDKIEITKEFLNELEAKSWHEIDHLQNQIINIANTKENTELLKLLNGLLTSYYVFTGGLERLTSNETVPSIENNEQEAQQAAELNKMSTTVDELPVEEPVLAEFASDIVTETTDFEPFEYFVDFDEPTGDALTDEDLYNL